MIGGSGFDYLAYVAFLREKRWGAAGGALTRAKLDHVAATPDHPIRAWLRAPLLDCTISFAIVVLFSAVFVACGTIVLGPQHEIPDAKNLLDLQAQFVVSLHPWLLPLYVTGALAAMLGTLYGTIGVASTVFIELRRAISPQAPNSATIRQHHVAAVTWCVLGAAAILTWLFLRQQGGEGDRPKILIDMITPVSLLTGVFGCGLIAALNLWMDKRYLPRSLRMPPALLAVNALSCVVFAAAGLKGYWDTDHPWVAVGAIVGVCAFAIVRCRAPR